VQTPPRQHSAECWSGEAQGVILWKAWDTAVRNVDVVLTPCARGHTTGYAALCRHVRFHQSIFSDLLAG